MTMLAQILQKNARRLEILAACILTVAGVLKVVASFRAIPVMTMQNGLLPLSNGNLYFCAGLLELIVAYYQGVGADLNIKSLALLFMATCFSAYRIGWYFAGLTAPCSCLGTGYDWWPWFARNQQTISSAMFVVFIVIAGLHVLAVFFFSRSSSLNFKLHENH